MVAFNRPLFVVVAVRENQNKASLAVAARAPPAGLSASSCKRPTVCRSLGRAGRVERPDRVGTRRHSVRYLTSESDCGEGRCSGIVSAPIVFVGLAS